jgi:hypothetical protein
VESFCSSFDFSSMSHALKSNVSRQSLFKTMFHVIKCTGTATVLRRVVH